MICPHCGMDTEAQVVKHDYATVLNEMNRILGTQFRFTDKFKKLCAARYREGFTTEDLIKVVQNMHKAWGNDPKMAEFLRPVTLFGTKMDSYLNRVQANKQTNNGLKEGIVW